MRKYVPFLVLVAAVGAVWWAISLVVAENESGTVASFASSTLGVSFEYPSMYEIVEELPANLGDALYSASLIEDGFIPPEAGEGPTSITITVFENGVEGRTVENFAQERTGGRGLGQAVSRTVGGEEGIEYAWTGLYEGKSVAVVLPEHIYEFSVTWLSPEDRILRDFETLLGTVSFIKE